MGSKYEFSINATLDLHRYTIAEALDAVEIFLDDAADQGFTLVRIITGKGIHSTGKETLRETVPAWLVAKGYAYRPAKRSQGGDGAFLVPLA